jgi:CheY-like chemotaxis protein
MPAKILIVEDERITAEDLRDILTDLGYLVTRIVSSGAEAIAEVEQNRPDLALMDIHIEGQMDGTEVARAILAGYDVPSIFLSAHADAHTLSRARAAQPLGYLTKPFRDYELRTIIDAALARSKAVEAVSMADRRGSRVVSRDAEVAAVSEEMSLWFDLCAASPKATFASG